MFVKLNPGVKYEQSFIWSFQVVRGENLTVHLISGQTEIYVLTGKTQESRDVEVSVSLILKM